MDTRVLAYGIGNDGRSGDLLCAGSLLLPYLTTFHPAPTTTNQEANLDGLQRYVGGRHSGEARVRLVVVGAQIEVVDGTVFFGTGEQPDGAAQDDGWIASAILNRPSSQRCTKLPAGPNGDDADPSRILSLFEASPVSITAADRARPRPGRPRASTTARRATAVAVKRVWPPTGDDTKWVPKRPPWLPPLIPFPLPDFDCSIVRPHCHFLCNFLCDCD